MFRWRQYNRILPVVLLVAGGICGCEKKQPSSSPGEPVQEEIVEEVEVIPSASSQPAQDTSEKRNASSISQNEIVKTVAGAQWPTDPKERAKAVQQRLNTVATNINHAFGTQINVFYGAPGQAADSDGEGTVQVDFAMVWQLSEDGLAVLLAREFAHETLGQHKDRYMLRKQADQTHGPMQQLRGLEQNADRLAGQMLAHTDYSWNGYEQVWSAVRQTEYILSTMRAYYPLAERLRIMEQAYDQEKQRLSADALLQLPTDTQSSDAES